MNLLLYGAPGSGKGTQANMLRSKFGIPHIATGDMLRAEIAHGSELGRQAQPLLAAGGYVPDGIMIEMIRDRLRRPDCGKGFILDGFPRTIPQAEALDVLMKELGRTFDRVLYLRVNTPSCSAAFPAGWSAQPASGRTRRPPSDARPMARSWFSARTTSRKPCSRGSRSTCTKRSPSWITTGPRTWFRRSMVGAALMR